METIPSSLKSTTSTPGTPEPPAPLAPLVPTVPPRIHREGHLATQPQKQQRAPAVLPIEPSGRVAGHRVGSARQERPGVEAAGARERGRAFAISTVSQWVPCQWFGRSMPHIPHASRTGPSARLGTKTEAKGRVCFVNVARFWSFWALFGVSLARRPSPTVPGVQLEPPTCTWPYCPFIALCDCTFGPS